MLCVGQVSHVLICFVSLAFATRSKYRSLAEWLQNSASAADRQHFIDFVQLVEDWEFAQGLSPEKRDVEPDGCVTVRLGQQLSVELRFKVI